MTLATVEASAPLATPIRHDWTRAEIRALFELPFPELMFRAQSVHRAHFDPTEVQISTLLSIKTGGCPEDCAYCPQSAQLRHRRQGREADEPRCGAGRGARRQAPPAPAASAWARPGASRRIAISTRSARWSRASTRSGSRPAPRSACSTPSRRARLKTAGLDYYNHNLDTSPEYYGEIITTRTYQERLDTLGACARRRHQCVLRRHRRHGRGRARIASA